MIEERLRAEHDAKQAKVDRSKPGEGADEGQHARHFAKLTHVVDGELRIVVRPAADRADRGALRRRRDATTIEEEIRDAVPRVPAHVAARPASGCSRSSAIVDLARKVVGVGSVGTRAWIVLLLGRDDGDPLFLQIKEAEAVGARAPVGKSEFDNHGQRVVEGQRLMQAASDIFLGWLRNPTGSTASSATSTSASSGTGRCSADLDTILPARAGALRGHLRLDARTRPRPLGRPDRDRGVPRQERCLRPCRSPTSRPRTPTSTSATMPC